MSETRKKPKRAAAAKGSATAKLAAAKGATQRGCPRLRITLGEGLILGPGKVDLIDAIERTGSISAAGRAMGMSYRRAWLLVDALNRMFKQPVVVAATGGAKGGGAKLTDFGRGVASAYRRAEERSRLAVSEEFARVDVEVD